MPHTVVDTKADIAVDRTISLAVLDCPFIGCN